MRHVQSTQFVYRLECLRAAFDIKTDRIDHRIAPVHSQSHRGLIADIGVDRFGFSLCPRLFRNIGVARTANSNANRNSLCKKTLYNLPTQKTGTSKYNNAADI
jgi:hypothetical protein